MLSGFRQIASSTASKILLMLVMLTFVLWGIGDVMRGGNKNAVLIVADKEFTDHEWYNYFNNTVAHFEKAAGRKVSKEEIKANNVVEIIANQLIDNLLLQVDAEKKGLLVSDEMVFSRMAEIKEFQSNDKFDKKLFKAFLEKNQQSEETFFTNFKNIMKNELALSPFSMISPVPEMLKDAVSKAHSLNYNFKLAEIGRRDFLMLSVDKQPSDLELQAQYELHKDSFAIPDKRSISYMQFSASDMKVSESVPLEKLKELYNQKIDFYSDPEKRLVDMLMFDNSEKANQAAAEIKAGKSFNEVGKKYLGIDNASMGYVSKSGFDKETASAIFATELHSFSKVIKTPMGFAIFKVNEIKPAKVSSFEDVKEQVKAEYLSEQKFELLSQLGQEIEKLASEGNKLQEIAAKYGFKTGSLKNISSADSTKDKLLEDKNFNHLAFSTPTQSISHVAPFSDALDQFFVIQVDESSGAGYLSFENVKAKVVDLWTTDQRKKLIEEKLATIEAEVRKGGDFANLVARELNVRVQDADTNTAVPLGNLPEKITNEIFKLKVQEITGLHEDPRNGMLYIAQLTSITSGKPDNAAVSMVEFDLARSLAEERSAAYTLNLRKQYSVKFNSELAHKLVGVE